jgi:site-specific DNA recombinase
VNDNNGHGPKRAVLYARVSTDEQSKSGYSIPDQLRVLREHAARERYTVVQEITDDGYSGTTPDRPGLNRVLELAERGEIDAVVATKRDRFFRSRLHRLLFDQDLAQFGVTAIALNNTNNVIGDSVLDSFAEYERDQIAERLKSGKRQKARQGKVIATNQPTYGFRYNDARDGYLIDPDTMAVVHRIFLLVANGATIYSVVETLEREGVSSPRAGQYNTSGRWSEAMIRRIVLSDVYVPFAHAEVKALVMPEVAARLDHDACYGLWRYAGIAVPVPDSGISREVVEKPETLSVSGLFVIWKEDLDPLDHEHIALGLDLSDRLCVEVLERYLTRCQRARKGAEQSATRSSDHVIERGVVGFHVLR